MCHCNLLPCLSLQLVAFLFADLCANVTCDAPRDVCTLSTVLRCYSATLLMGSAPSATSPAQFLPLTLVVKISRDKFAAGTGVITFSEKPGGSTNPIYTPSEYGATSPKCPDRHIWRFFPGPGSVSLSCY
jgi:hypothetical protein